MNIELSQYMNEKGTMVDWAKNVVGKKPLTEEQIAISETVNKFALEVANSGVGDTALSQYLVRVVQDEIYNQPSELLDVMFDQGQMGEFDDYGSVGTYKNNLLAHESAIRGGSVDKSYVDFTRSEMIHKHLQVETEIRYDELRRNGALTIATLTMDAIEALQNKKFQAIFDHINGLLLAGDNVFNGTGGLTVQLMDEFAGYISDYASSNEKLMVGLSGDLRTIKTMPNYDKFLSEEMKGELNMGSNILNYYGGVPIASISSGKKLADKTTLLPAKTIYGFSDKIGKADTRGELRVYQTPNNAKEVLGLKFTGFEFVFAIDHIEKISKITLQ